MGNVGKTKFKEGQRALSLLNCRRLPGRLNTTEAAILLGFQEHDIPALTFAKLLAPLGKPATNAPKYFAGGGYARVQFQNIGQKNSREKLSSLEDAAAA